jgi:hypothetical protein
MTRNLFVASLLLLASALLMAACDTPSKIARREVDRFTRLTQQTEIEVNSVARTALVDVATAEGHRRGKELKVAGCGPACATQPSGSLVDPCRDIVAASEAEEALDLAQSFRGKAWIVGEIASGEKGVKLIEAH